MLLVITASCRSHHCLSSVSVDVTTNAVTADSERPGSCYVNNLTQAEHCCHSECLGGCSGGSSADCFACVHVFHNGRCLARCPRGFYQVIRLCWLPFVDYNLQGFIVLGLGCTVRKIFHINSSYMWTKVCCLGYVFFRHISLEIELLCFQVVSILYVFACLLLCATLLLVKLSCPGPSLYTSLHRLTQEFFKKYYCSIVWTILWTAAATSSCGTGPLCFLARCHKMRLQESLVVFGLDFLYVTRF